MISRSSLQKETMAKRARKKAMDNRMSEKMVSPRKKMDMGRSPGKGMGADSAPMAFKKGGAVKEYARGGMASKTAPNNSAKTITPRMGGARPGVNVRGATPNNSAKTITPRVGGARPGATPNNASALARSKQEAQKQPQETAGLNDAMARYKSQTGASTSTSNFSRSPDSAANAQKAFSSFMRDRAPQQANPNDAMTARAQQAQGQAASNAATTARAQQAQMQQAGTPPMGMKKGGAVDKKKRMFKKDGGMAMKKGMKDMKGKGGMMLLIGIGKKGKK
jgi:hypothetical protein